jgi:hypothetical protein
MSTSLGRSLILTLVISVVACGTKVPAPPDVAAPPPDSLKTTSGLSIKVLQKGTGTRRPTTSDRVTVHYTGWTTDGEMFDTSTDGSPATFGVTQVIDGWTEALQRMVEGEKCACGSRRNSRMPARQASRPACSFLILNC